MKWFITVIMLCSILHTEVKAEITLSDLNIQTQKTLAAQQLYTLSVDEFSALTSQIHAAFNRWQTLKLLAISYYASGNYFRGDMYATAALIDQYEYDRLTALVPTKQTEVNNKKQAYLQEYDRLNTMFDAYYK